MHSDDLDDPLDDLLSGGPRSATPRPMAPHTPATYKPAEHVETCPSCRGTGRFRSYTGRLLGECFKCKGKGSRTFKASAETRQRNRDNAAARKARKSEEAIEAFKAEHPAVWGWMDGSTFEFAVKMREAVAKYGYLTERQLAASYNCVAKLEAAKARRQAERTAAIETAPAVDTSALDRAFASAAAAGLKYPTLRVAGVVVSPASAGSRNAGALYVKAGGQYLGKIAGGRFLAQAGVDEATKAKVAELVSDPQNAAKAYGVETGTCSCCGRQLTDPESIAAGIGPICQERFFGR